jgi:hypothetical protein
MKHTELAARENAFWQEVHEGVATRGWRLGQAVANVGSPDMPTLTDGSLIDPFHHDDRIGVYMARLRQQWLRQSA